MVKRLLTLTPYPQWVPDDPEYALPAKELAEFGPISSDRWVLNASLTIGIGIATMMILEVIDFFDLVEQDNVWMLGLDLVAGAVVGLALVKGAALALREMSERRSAAASAREAHGQIEILFQMADMLQSATTYADANAVILSTAAKLLSGYGGALYIFNNSGDRLDLSTAWGWPNESPPPESILPSHCWALKRGRPHLNSGSAGALLCQHHDQSDVSLEIPMMARGEVYGLLKVSADREHGEERLQGIKPMVTAIADAISITLANIALREKLRTRALRDPLTGLYNRRYMEDVLERYGNMAERNSGRLSAVMIDLDHFKRLNDEHGHALGDAVLCDVAAVLSADLRPCDVACRYGGEELVVLLPDCTLSDALAKGEAIRARIEGLSENRGFRVTASLGVATFPDTSAKSLELLPNADAALYRAKRQGRNRVEAAGLRRATADDRNLQLVAE